MAEFLVELYVSRAIPGAVANETQRARKAAFELTAEGIPVRFLRSIFVPEDETCLFLYEAGSVEAVHEAAHRAALTFEHVAETAPEPD
jgi:Nickel responsive protein SCO4226-like